jgi:CheY-like chemotaxis protein
MTDSGGGRPIEILLVEDSPDDATLTIEALKEGKVQNHVHLAEDGVEALAFLRREGARANSPRPDLVLLDLNLPKKNGWEVLAEIKDDANLRRIPVVIMTTSDDQKHVNEAYDLHANCYVTKPIDVDEFIGAVRKIEDFWLTIVRLPAA